MTLVRPEFEEPGRGELWIELTLATFFAWLIEMGGGPFWNIFAMGIGMMLVFNYHWFVRKVEEFLS